MIQIIRSRKSLINTISVIFVTVFTFLSECDQFEDLEDVIFQDIEIMTE